MEPIMVGHDSRARSVAGEVFVGVVIVGVLYFARQVLVPIALAIILSFVLSIPVQRLRRIGLRQLPAVLVVVSSAFVAMVGVGAVVGGQIVQLAGDLPRYQFTIQDKLKSLHEMTGGSSIVESLGRFVKTISSDYLEASAQPAANDKQPQPVPVVVQQPIPKPLQVIERIIGPLLEPLATTGLVIVFVIFILLQQRDLRDRLIWLLGSHDLRRSTEAIDVAAKRLSRFFLMQTAINAAFGILIGLGLWAIGVPNPVLWGGLAMMLRFVPYVGAIMATLLPLALAAAVDPGWTMVLWTLGLFLTLETLVGQVIEPWLYGRSTGLSPIAVAIAATFWTWLWGPIGLVLSTPLTMLVVVIGQHVDRLAYLAVIFGDAPALTAEQSFFHRIMSSNADEAAERAQSYLKEQPLLAYYDDVALPGLRLAQIEANKGAIDVEDLRRMAATVEQIVDNFEDVGPDAVPPTGAKAEPTEEETSADPELPALSADWRGEAPVLCIAGRSPLDEAAAAMLQQLLTRKGIGVRIASFGSATPAQIMKLDLQGVAMICLSYIAVDGSPTHTRFLIRRLRRKAPGTPILAAFWTYDDDEKLALEELRKESGADTVATTMRQAIEICVNEATAKVEPVRPLQQAEPLQAQTA